MKKFKVKYYEIRRNTGGDQYEEVVEEEIKAFGVQINNSGHAEFMNDNNSTLKAVFTCFISIIEVEQNG